MLKELGEGRRGKGMKSRGKVEKIDMFVSLSRQKSIQILIGAGILYILMVTLEIPFVFRAGFSAVPQESLSRSQLLESEEDLEERVAPTRPSKLVSQNSPQPTGAAEYKIVSGLKFDPSVFNSGTGDGVPELYKSARVAWEVGNKFWEELQSGRLQTMTREKIQNRSESCSNSLSLTGSEFVEKKQVMVLPCGLTLGSHVTLVGKPRQARAEHEPKISLVKDVEETVMVSQFMVELQGLNAVEGEDPPRVLHLNPRLKGDWSGRPVIELNTCYRMQWSSALRCEGWKSKADEETSK